MMARRLPVPGCARTQPSTSFSSIDTKNMRSASDRWAMEKIDTRALPSGVNSIRPMSSGSPSSQVWNPGAASRLLMRMASSKRSFSG